MCRQAPFGDKVKIDKDVIKSYITNIIKQMFVPIPYLHNLEIIQSFRIQDSMNYEQIRHQISTIESTVLDANESKRKNKRTRILQLLNDNDVKIIIIPFDQKWIIADCEPLPIIKCINCHVYKRDLNQKHLLVSNNIAKLMTCINIDLPVSIGYNIVKYRTISKPSNIRLPPVSLQRVTNENIRKIVTNGV